MFIFLWISSFLLSDVLRRGGTSSFVIVSLYVLIRVVDQEGISYTSVFVGVSRFLSLGFYHVFEEEGRLGTFVIASL